MKKAIVIDPEILSGKPVIAGTRIPVTMILTLLASGVSVEVLLNDYYPQLTKESIHAAIQYAASVLDREEIHFVEKKKDKVYEASL